MDSTYTAAGVGQLQHIYLAVYSSRRRAQEGQAMQDTQALRSRHASSSHAASIRHDESIESWGSTATRSSMRRNQTQSRLAACRRASISLSTRHARRPPAHELATRMEAPGWMIWIAPRADHCRAGSTRSASALPGSATLL